MGHILENTPGNIHRSFNNRLQHGYLIEGNQEDPWYNDPQHPEANAPSSSNNWAQPYQENSGIFVGEASTQQSLPNEYDSGTDTDTESSVGETLYAEPDPNRTRNEWLQELYWAYQKAKGAWRRATNKPTRKVRTFFSGDALRIKERGRARVGGPG